MKIQVRNQAELRSRKKNRCKFEKTAVASNRCKVEKMSEVEIDMAKVAVHVSIVEKMSLVETTGLNFNTPLEMKSKTPGTLVCAVPGFVLM